LTVETEDWENLLDAVKGADVFLDTLVRFSSGDENDASDMRLLSEKLSRDQEWGLSPIQTVQCQTLVDPTPRAELKLQLISSAA